MKAILYTAPWCGPCKPVARALEELAPSFPAVAFETVDLDARPEQGARHGVLTLPTVVLERGGEVVARIEGARKPGEYERALREVVPAGERAEP